jgi:MFS family permease
MFRMMGLFMVFPVMTLYGVQYIDSTEQRLGFAIGAYGLSQAICQMPLGLLSDLYGRKTIIFIGLLIMIVGSVVAALSDSVWGLIIGRTLQGIGAVGSTIMALVGDLTTEQNRTKAMAVIGASIGISFVLAMVLGSTLASFWGLSSIFWVTGGLSLIGCYILFHQVPNPPTTLRGKDAIAVPAMIGQSLRNIELARLNFGIFSLHFILAALFVALPLALQDAGIAAAQHWQFYGPILALAFIAMMPFMHLAERKRKVKPVLLAAIAGLAGGLVLLQVAGTTWFSWASGLFVFFMSFCLLEATLPSLLSKQAPAGAKGTAMGLFSTCQFLGISAGGVLGGYWVQHHSTITVFYYTAALASLWFALALFMRKPVYLTSISVALAYEPQIEPLRAKIAGIYEAVWVKEQSLLHLKVQDSEFDRRQLDDYLAQTHAA